MKSRINSKPYRGFSQPVLDNREHLTKTVRSVLPGVRIYPEYLVGVLDLGSSD